MNSLSALDNSINGLDGSLETVNSSLNYLNDTLNRLEGIVERVERIVAVGEAAVAPLAATRNRGASGGEGCPRPHAPLVGAHSPITGGATSGNSPISSVVLPAEIRYLGARCSAPPSRPSSPG